MNTPKCYSIIMLLLAAFATIALQAVTIVDTGLVTNPPTATANLINPKGVSLTAATGSTAESTIESISGLHVIQDFSTSLAGGDNVFAFTDSSLPDIEISFSGGVTTTTGTSLSNSSFLTSETNSMRIQGDRTGTFAMTIDFGVWNGSSFSSSGATVDAAAFTLFGNSGEFASFSVDYLDTSNAVITTQTLSGTNGYFGLESTTPIGAIVITFNPAGSNDGPLGFDDLAFLPSGGGATPEEVIIDNLNAEFDGTWDSSTYAGDFYDTNYQYNTSGTGADKVRWRPDLVAGDYAVYVWFPDGTVGSRPDDAPFTVYHAGGSTTYLVDETGPGGAWVYLGTHSFNSGTGGYVELTDDTSNTYVIADAVRFDPSTASNQVAAPVFSPGGGTYASAQTVSMSTTTGGASIRYTTDGSTPTSTTGILYSSPILISTTTTLKAIAYASGMTDSTVTSASYAIQEEVIIDNLNAEFDGTWNSSTYVAGYYGTDYQYNTSGTGADKVRWRPDLVAGDYDVYIWLPDGTGSRSDDAPFTVYDASGATTYLVDETVSGGAWVYLGTHSFNSGTDGYVELTDDASNTYVIADAVRFDPATVSNQVAAPVFNPGGGSYTSAQSVSMSTTTSGASIRYTTDGSNPTSTTGTLYTGVVTINSTTTLKAIAYATGMTDSTVTSASYTITTGGAPLYGARGAWPSLTPNPDALPTATYSNLNDLVIALRTAQAGDVYHLTSFNLTTITTLNDATAQANLATLTSNVLVRPAPGETVDIQARLTSQLPNITWAYFKLNDKFGLSLGSDRSRLARIQIGPQGKLQITASSYHEFVECLKPVRGGPPSPGVAAGDTMQITSMQINGVVQDTPTDLLWDSCWLEGMDIVDLGEHSDTIQFLASSGTMTFRNTYIGPAGNNASLQFNLFYQPSGLPYALFDLDTCFMGGAIIYGNGNVLGSFDTPAIIRRVEYPQLVSRGDPFVLPAVVEDCKIQASDITIHSDLGGGSMSSLYPNNEYGATITWPTFVEPSWWD